MKIAILSTFESYGGAAIAAKRLQKALIKNGDTANMVVQEKRAMMTQFIHFQLLTSENYLQNLDSP